MIRSKRLFFCTASWLALGPTQPPILWISGALSPGIKLLGVKVTTHFHLVLRLRIFAAIPPLPHISS
jgi:hypothetical protein